tara:strand:- start:3832 stop:4584 length:753 start_codon:yes stop_codon:yes gene_type:complete
MSAITTGVDYYLAYQFLKKLTTPFNKTEAFKLGIIDKNGKVLRKRKELSSKERDSYKIMDTIAFNLKKLLQKLPGGKSKIASLGAALFLMKEETIIKESFPQSSFFEYHRNSFEEEFKQFINSQECFDSLQGMAQYLKEEEVQILLIPEDGPTVVTTGQAGLGTNPPGPSRRFAGAKVFKVPTTTFMRARLGKKKYARYRKILGEIDNGEEIRQYCLKNYKDPIVLEDERTGAMLYLRYGKDRDVSRLTV